MSILVSLSKIGCFSMYLEFDDKSYKIEIIYKNNKNMYLRVKDDLRIVVTVPFGIKDKVIMKFISDNIEYIKKVLSSKESIKSRKKDKFEYLGNLYDICRINEKKVVLGDNRVFIGNSVNVDSWYKKQAKIVFEECYDKCFSRFKESVFKPVLKIRKMSSKWGVCNISNGSITLNLQLIKLDPKYLEYVIYHELCHLKYCDHSSKFWALVEKYVPDYKLIRKEMKNV